MLVIVAAGGAGVYATQSPTSSPEVAATSQARAAPAAEGVPPGAELTAAAPSVTPSVTPSGPGSGSPGPDSTAQPALPGASASSSLDTSLGSFVTAQSAGAAVGRGTVRRYKVEVEQGTGVDPEQAAALIQGILADKRSWTTDGKNGFQLVSSGTFDFEVKIASPATVDRICATGGLDTHGEVNCSVGKQVVVNLTRWNTGSPQFTGSLDDYRALIVNHEVGHRIGHGHESCPGPGQPAPAMMQQIDGLKGCVANAWPYGADGGYLGGPAVP